MLVHYIDIATTIHGESTDIVHTGNASKRELQFVKHSQSIVREMFHHVHRRLAPWLDGSGSCTLSFCALSFHALSSLTLSRHWFAHRLASIVASYTFDKGASALSKGYFIVLFVSHPSATGTGEAQAKLDYCNRWKAISRPGSLISWSIVSSRPVEEENLLPGCRLEMNWREMGAMTKVSQLYGSCRGVRQGLE